MRKQIRGHGSEIYIDFYDLYDYNEEYAKKILDNPDTEIPLLIGYVNGRTERDVQTHIIHLLPGPTKIHEVTREKMYKLIEVNGIVIQMGVIKKRPWKLFYKCSCGEDVPIEQKDQWKEKPETCPYCKKSGPFTRVYKKTEFSDYQWIEIQEQVENTPTGETPATIRVRLKNHLTKSCTPGEVVTIVAVPKVYEKTPNQMKLEMECYLDAVSVVNDTERENMDLTEEDINKLRELAENPDHLKNVVKSFAPTVYGEDPVKEALAYQQCEGVERFLTKQKRRRGQFHILLAGPPGVAKSDLGEYAALYHIKGVKATGRGSSTVGLTASVVQLDGEWVLKAGAMALADRGLLFVDEIEKMRTEDSGAMHPGMETQEIPINKAGINATVKTRCSIVAACNPVNGVWDDAGTITANLITKGGGLTIPLLNRFALIFVVREKDTAEEEEEVIDHILSINKDMNNLDPPYDEETLRKLFTYARTFKPKLTDKASDKLKEFYMDLFKASKITQTTIMSRRQIEDLLRLAEASAKLHLRETVTVEDADNSIRVTAASLKQYGIDPMSGNIDYNIITTGLSQSEIKMREMLPTIVDSLADENEDGPWVNVNVLRKHLMERYKIGELEASSFLNHAEKAKIIYYRGLRTEGQIKRS